MQQHDTVPQLRTESFKEPPANQKKKMQNLKVNKKTMVTMRHIKSHEIPKNHSQNCSLPFVNCWRFMFGRIQVYNCIWLCCSMNGWESIVVFFGVTSLVWKIWKIFKENSLQTFHCLKYFQVKLIPKGFVDLYVMKGNCYLSQMAMKNFVYGYIVLTET